MGSADGLRHHAGARGRTGSGREVDLPGSSSNCWTSPTTSMPVVGIDLGTTFSAIATLDDRGQPVTLPNRDGDMLTPSAVLLSTTAPPSSARPRSTWPWNSPTASPRSSSGAWASPTFGRPVAGREFRPETLSAIILRKLVQDAELPHRPDRARPSSPSRPTSTTPAARRPRTPAASPGSTCSTSSTSRPPPPWPTRSSRRRQLPALGPPTLPANEQTVLVYDLGGGTFDVTLVRLSPAALPDAGHRGRRAAGRQGLGRPHRRSRRRASSQQQHGDDPRSDPQSLAVLHAAAERAKRTLSKLHADERHLHPRRARC